VKFNKKAFKTHAPNDIQWAPLVSLMPSPNNVRLFIERESLDTLRGLYRRHRAGEAVVLPDPPIVRFRGWRKGGGIPNLEVLAGERRVTAMSLEGVELAAVRVVTMADDDAYRFILDHNDVKALSTAERAYRAAEMERLGFGETEVDAAMGGVASYRYVLVGSLIDPDWFTDDPKRCDPSIIQWHEAARFGAAHFKRCFLNWNSGAWDAAKCAAEFRRRGKKLPLDNAERGLRVTYDGASFIVRGKVDLSIHWEDTADAILARLAEEIENARAKLRAGNDFGTRTIVYVNPTTVAV
jgi:hypothetical protein